MLTALLPVASGNLRNENWLNFPLEKEHILQMAAPIEWQTLGPPRSLPHAGALLH